MNRQRLYLQDVQECIRRIETVTAGGRAEFEQSFVVQDVVVRNFEVIGEIVKRLAPELTTDHPHIPWHEIAGFRDVLIHDYDKIDLDVVWRAVEEDVPSLKVAIQAMLARLDDQSNTKSGT